MVPLCRPAVPIVLNRFAELPLFNVDFLNIDTGMTMDQINEHTDSFQFSDSSHPDYCAISHDFFRIGDLCRRIRKVRPLP